jgi:DNA-binding NarL/FixJ family response regulator
LLPHYWVSGFSPLAICGDCGTQKYYIFLELQVIMPRTMPIDPALVVVLSISLYRAQSLALALRESEYNATVVNSRDAAVLARFPMILIEVDGYLTPYLELIGSITALNPDAKVIVLGIVESEENVVSLAEVGASGYVPQGVSLEELTAVLLSVQNGEFACAPSITYALFSHLCRLSQQSSSASCSAEVLTIRQQKVLELLLRKLSNKEIAERLCLSEHTVKNHVHHILKKLGVHDRSLVHNAALRSTALPAARRLLQAS